MRVVAVLSGALMNTDLPLRHFPTEDQPLSLTGKASKSTNNVLICIDTQLYNVQLTNTWTKKYFVFFVSPYF